MPKSTITITDDGKQVKFEVAHDPPLAGPRSGWPLPAKAAEIMVRDFMKRGEEKGLKPAFEVIKNSITGHIDVTTRKEQE